MRADEELQPNRSCIAIEPEKFLRGLGRRARHFLQATPRAAAMLSATSRVCAGSQRFPRNGTGARYGQSVSTMNSPNDKRAATSRTLRRS